MHSLQHIVALICIIILLFSSKASEAKRPNVVVVLADDLGWNDLGFHGSSQIPTPNLDALANDGIILKNHYVQQLCTPTRSALLTGRYPARMGMQHGVISSAEPYGLPLNETLLPQYLKELNYSTHIVGKWHLGFYAKDYLPTRRGFDSHFGFYQGCGDYLDHTYAPDAPDDLKSWGLDFHRNEEVVRDGFGQYSTELFTGEAVSIIKQHNTSEDQPLFLYLAHQAVHSGTGGTSQPLEAPHRFIDRVAHIKHPGRRLYAAMVMALDESVGNVTRALYERGMLNNTIIIFTSDNGGPANGYNYNYASNWPLRGMKNTLWEGGIRAAGFIWSPLLQKSGYTSTHLLHVTDWLPTLLHIAGYNMSRLTSLDGVNQWEALSYNKESLRKEILHNFDPRWNATALRVGDFKILYDVKGHTKKYDDWYKPDDINDSLSKKKNLSKSDISEMELQRSDLARQIVYWSKMPDRNISGTANQELLLENTRQNLMFKNTSQSLLFQQHSLANFINTNFLKSITDWKNSNGLIMTQDNKSAMSWKKPVSTSFAINRSAYESSDFKIHEILAKIGRYVNLSRRSPLVVTCNDGDHLKTSVDDKRNNVRMLWNRFMNRLNGRQYNDKLSSIFSPEGDVRDVDYISNVIVKCLPAIEPCLFNIAVDPCEKHNIADNYPDIVSSMLERLKYYKSISVPPINKPVDEKGLPYHHGRLWVPWVILDSVN